MKLVLAINLSLSIYLRILYDKIKPFLNWRFLISFGLAWNITNGWCYAFMFIGKFAHISWMWKVGLAYYGFLWLPTTPEKLVTIPLAILFHRKLFPRDFANMDKLNNMLKKEKGRK